MRKTYELKFKTVGTYTEETVELSHYQEIYSDQDMSILETEIESIYLDEVLSEVTKDIESDPLLEFYTGSGNYEFPQLAFEVLEDDGTTRVSMKFFAI